MRQMLSVLLLASVSGCIVYSDGGPPAPPANSAPWFEYADAGCFWDGGYADYVWYFDADVDDDLGTIDVQAVWADVYDDATGELADSFELYPEVGKTWYSAWIGRTTWLDPAYPYYAVVLGAQDSEGAIGSTEVYPIPCY